jgi:hypothetical protein
MYLGNPILTTVDELFDWAGEPRSETVAMTAIPADIAAEMKAYRRANSATEQNEQSKSAGVEKIDISKLPKYEGGWV